jgi:hypothetical protein
MTATGSERYVTTSGIRAAARGRETIILDGLGIDWKQPTTKPHIHCPYREHADDNPSWRWDGRRRKAFCTCAKADSIFDVLMKVEGLDFDRAKIRAAELLNRSDLIRESHARKNKGGRGDVPPEQQRNGATPAGCRLADYATAKRLPIDFLRSLGLAEIAYQGAPAVKIPYLTADGAEAAVRFRIALDGKDRFRWRKGSKLCLYGINRLGEAREAGHAIIVEGESDAQTLWLHDFAALGLPGAGNWNEQRDAPLLADLTTIYIVIEPDQGGDAVIGWLRRSSIAPRARLVRLRGTKDASALYLADPDGFRAAFQRALDEAEPYPAIADREAEAAAAAAIETAGDLVLEPDILARFGAELGRAGLVGEDNNAKVLFLALTTRLFQRPVSVAVKGPSSGGKSYIVEVVLRFFPTTAYWSRTAMSERALAYSDEDFRHRHLVIFEAAGMTSDFGSYLIRSLLSEGRIDYEFPEKTKDGMRPRVIRKEGPTGLVVTTTAPRLHPENETRLLSLTVKDTAEQTKIILRALARSAETAGAVDYTRWQAFQTWLETGQCRVVVPFAGRLADMMPPVAVRLRRDFRLLLALIEAHALLHRELRERDEQGRILATLGDYAAVRELIADLFAEGVDATVKPETRETVAAVKELGKDEVSVSEIARALKLDKGAVSRRVADAVSRGYLANSETRKGRPARITPGDAMPDEIEILPHPDRLAGCCSGAPLWEGDGTPSPPFHEDDPAGVPAFAEVEIE